MMPNQVTHPWTDKEIDFLRENIQKLTYKQMGQVIKRSPSSIQSKIRYLPFQQKIKKHPVNSNFFKTWSPQMAYTLGFIAADGNICHSGRAHVLHIACDDLDVIEKIKAVIEYHGPIHQKPRSNGKISYSLRICDPIIFQDLIRLNITERKSLTFNPPSIPKQFIRDFIRGYFDGDGSVTVRNHPYPSKLAVNLDTASKLMAEWLYTIVKELFDTGIYNGKILMKLVNQKTPYYSVHLGHKASANFFDYMYSGAAIYMERKHQKFLKGFNHVN